MSADTRFENFQAWAIKTLQLLSSPARVQIEYLRSVGVDADELLLEFDDLIKAAQGFVFDGWLDSSDYHSLEVVENDANAVNSAGAHIWSARALSESQEWAALRIAAESAKLTLSESWNLWK